MLKTILMLLVLGLLPVPAVLSESPEKQTDSILATVNGDPITLSDVLDYTRKDESVAHATARNAEELNLRIEEIRRKMLETLIDNKLILQEYEKKPFDLDEQYIENRIDEIIERSGTTSRREFARKLRQSGMTMEELRTEARKQIILAAMVAGYCSMTVNITPREVYEYYQLHPAEFGHPEQVRLQLLLLDASLPEYAEKLRQLQNTLPGTAENPVDFTTLSEKFSDAPNAASGGDLGFLPLADLRAEFKAALPEIPPANTVYGPLSLPEGTAWLRVIEYQSADLIPYERAMTPLRQRLEEAQRQKNLQQYVAKLRTQAILVYF